MQDDSYNGRDEILMQMREAARYNEENMRGHSRKTPAYYQQDFLNNSQEEKESYQKSSTFGLRIFLCLIIWGGFFWMHMENAPILGYDTEKVVEAISTDVDLQDITNSVKISN